MVRYENQNHEKEAITSLPLTLLRGRPVISIECPPEFLKTDAICRGYGPMTDGCSIIEQNKPTADL